MSDQQAQELTPAERERFEAAFSEAYGCERFDPAERDEDWKVAHEAAEDIWLAARLPERPDEARLEAGARAGVEWACDEAEQAGRHLPRWANLDADTRLRCREQTRAVFAAARLPERPQDPTS